MRRTRPGGEKLPGAPRRGMKARHYRRLVELERMWADRLDLDPLYPFAEWRHAGELAAMREELQRPSTDTDAHVLAALAKVWPLGAWPVEIGRELGLSATSVAYHLASLVTHRLITEPALRSNGRRRAWTATEAVHKAFTEGLAKGRTLQAIHLELLTAAFRKRYGVTVGDPPTRPTPEGVDKMNRRLGGK